MTEARPLLAAAQRRPGAGVKVKRPRRRTTLTPARTGADWQPGEPSWVQAISICSSGRAGSRVRAWTPSLIWVLGQLSGDKMIDGVTRVERCGRSVFRGRPGWRAWRRERYGSRSQSICLTRGEETRAGRRFRRQQEPPRRLRGGADRREPGPPRRARGGCGRPCGRACGRPRGRPGCGRCAA